MLLKKAEAAENLSPMSKKLTAGGSLISVCQEYQERVKCFATYQLLLPVLSGSA
jgi:hypothetical protein